MITYVCDLCKDNTSLGNASSIRIVKPGGRTVEAEHVCGTCIESIEKHIKRLEVKCYPTGVSE